IYTWFVNNKQVSGEGANTFSFIPEDGDKVYVELTSSGKCSEGKMVSSDTVSVRVIEPLPVTVTLTASDTSVCSGTKVTFTATPENGGQNPVFIWYVNNEPINGVGISTY